MYFTHADEVWTAHPNLRALVLVAENVRNADVDDLESLIEMVDRRLASGAEAEMPEIAAWREVFSRMGLKPTQYRCAAEALLRRFRKDRNLPRLHPLVDYLNHASMAFAIPIAAFDCAKVADGITVRPADGSERYLTFQGDTENPPAGEIVFADREGNAHARRWTFRQSALSAVTPETDRALIVAEAHHAMATQDLAALEAELKAGLDGAGVRIGQSMMIDPADRRLEFD